jgi:hypothetical protein
MRSSVLQNICSTDFNLYHENGYQIVTRVQNDTESHFEIDLKFILSGNTPVTLLDIE